MRGAPNANPIEAIEELFRRTVPPDEVAAFIVEPIQGEGGYVVPPPEFHRELKTLAERHGILYIADEVQSGMGRTGRMFAVEHFGVVPDVICVAKGIASGMPLGAMIAPAEIMNWPSGAHASTFGGNPVCCAAALETIALLEEGLIDHAAETGEFLLARLRELQGKHALIGDVRGKGLMIGIELVRDRSPSSPAPVKPPMASAAFHEGSAVSAAAERDALVQACFRRGLLILGAGENTIRLSPPLVITQAQSETALRILNEALTEVGVRRSGRN